MIREPYYHSRLSTIKPKNFNNYTLVTYDLPITTHTTPQFAPRQTENDIIRSHRNHIHHRKDSIEPYYTKPRRNTGLPPVILNQFMYKDVESGDDESCAIVSDSEEEFIENVRVYPPRSSLRKVSDVYDIEPEDEINLVKLMKPISSLPKVQRSIEYDDIQEVNELLLLNSNNPNVLINFRERCLSNELTPPKCNQIFLNDNYDIKFKYLVRDDYDGNKCEYLI